MTTTAARINNSGTLFISGEFNEVTTSTIRINTTTQYAAQFDEVTYNSTNPAIKNLLAYTESFDTGSWTTSSISITQSITTSPNGTLTATKFTDTATTAGHFALLDSSLIAGTRYVQSVFVKSAERTFFHLSPSTGFTTNDNWVNFDLTAGTYSIQGTNSLGATAGIIDAGNGWWRCWMSMPAFATSGRIAFGPTSSLTTARLGNYTGNGIDGVYVWGAQLEIGSEPTIYQGIAAANTLVTPGFAKRETSDGSLYVTDKFDEVTGMITTDGLAGYWDIGKLESYVPGNTNLTDISGGTKNGTPSGPVTYSSANGGYLSFSGAAFYDCPLGFVYGTTPLVDRTIAAWYRCTSASTQLQGIIVIFGGDSTNTQFEIRLGSAGTGIVVQTNQTIGTSDVPVLRNTWYYVVGTESHSGGIATLRLYLNGGLVATTSYSDAPYSYTADRVRLGCQKSGFPRTLLGDISNAQFYTKALSAAEVTNNFEALRDRFGI